jgi:WD40 repeat protein
MRTKLMLIMAIIAVTLFMPSQTKAGESTNNIVFGWHQVNESGKILDISFIEGGSKFATLIENGEFQIRETETGNILKKFNNFSLASFANFELTPDGNRVLVANSSNGSIALYNLNDISLIKGASIYYGDTIATWVTNMAIDPVKPYVYVTIYARKGTTSNLIQRGQISVYNYETMELVAHLTDFTNEYYPCLAISPDGNYLTAINYGASYLQVWDLKKNELHRKFQLYDIDGKGDFVCSPQDIRFSEKNNGNIFYTGKFPKINGLGSEYDGLFIYNVVKNDIINDTFRSIVGGIFCGFDDDERIIHTNSFDLKILNIKENIEEFSTSIWKLTDSLVFHNNIIYSIIYDKIIGSGSNKMTMIRYDRETSVPSDPEPDKIIYPNPTNSTAIIEITCKNPSIEYQLMDINSRILEESASVTVNNQLQIDFSKYPTGIYFIRLNCDNRILTYKILKK